MRYIGNNVETEPIDLPIDATFLELLNMIYDTISVDRHYQLVLKCQLPTGMNKFQSLVVKNDRIIAHMLAAPSKYKMSLIELFIEHAPNHSNLRNGIGHCTWLSTSDTDVDQRMTNITSTSNFPAPTGYNIENVDEKNERNEEDEKDDKYNNRDDVINTNEIHLLDDDENCGHRDIIDLVIVQ